MQDSKKFPITDYVRKFHELWSTFCCEAAVLIGVFGFLEKILKNEPIGMVYGISLVLVTAFAFMIGFISAILRDK